MAIVRSASASWQGTIKEGRGSISTDSGALAAQPYGFQTRFEDKAGTNPEELIGAAHAGCYAMAFSKTLTDNDKTANSIDVTAHVSLEKQDEGFAITAIELILKAEIPNLSENDFASMAEATKNNCPVSKLLDAPITLKADLIN